MNTQEILVFPRDCIYGYNRFLPWNGINALIRSMAQETLWLARDEAEQSSDWIQPIPCAYIQNPALGYYTLQRIDQGREDLRTKISLVFGGHIDRIKHHGSVTCLFHETLARELKEELNLKRFPFNRSKPIGLIIDSSSIQASRHVAFVYEVITKLPLRIQATEEFSSHPEESRGFFKQTELSRLHKHFDPWSLILFQDYIVPSRRKMARQLELPLK